MIVTLSDPEPDLLDRLGAIREAGDVPLIGDARWPKAQWDSVAAAANSARPAADIAWATLTSGSSGTPRIVLRTAESWASSFDTVARLLDAGPEAAVWLPTPPAASLTLFSLAHSLADGPRAIFGDTNPAEATCLHGTPQALRTAVNAKHLPRLRTALIGGSHLDAGLRVQAQQAGIRVVSYYGAAELSFVAIDEGDGLRACDGVELSVRDGVLWVRSPYVAQGYVGAPGPLRFDGDWATVGDRAEIVDGRVRLRGRLDEAILSASATIVPEEVEAVLRSIPGVHDAMVFGLPRAPVGALVAAFVELDRHSDFSGALRAAVSEQLAPAHRPRVWFTGELPRTASGKLARAEAARRAIAGEVTRLVV